MYELAVWIKMFHMTFSPSHNRGKGVQLVYKQQQSRKYNRGKVAQLVYKPKQSHKFTYNYLYTIATHSYLNNYLKYF